MEVVGRPESERTRWTRRARTAGNLHGLGDAAAAADDLSAL
jgi:hypothetical protein